MDMTDMVITLWLIYGVIVIYLSHSKQENNNHNEAFKRAHCYYFYIVYYKSFSILEFDAKRAKAKNI